MLTGATGHFQLFAVDGSPRLRWRLLSANNRELGRSHSQFTDAESCLAAVHELPRLLPGLDVRTRRAEDNLWRWSLVGREGPVAVGGHGYDRQLRAVDAARRFSEYATTARISDVVIHSGARRWVRQGRIPAVRPVPPRYRLVRLRDEA